MQPLEQKVHFRMNMSTVQSVLCPLSSIQCSCRLQVAVCALKWVQRSLLQSKVVCPTASLISVVVQACMHRTRGSVKSSWVVCPGANLTCYNAGSAQCKMPCWAVLAKFKVQSAEYTVHSGQCILHSGPCWGVLLAPSNLSTSTHHLPNTHHWA